MSSLSLVLPPRIVIVHLLIVMSAIESLSPSFSLSLSLLFCLLSQDKTLPPSSCSLVSLSLLGCCCSSRSSSWPPTAYGENASGVAGGREKRGRGGEEDRCGEAREADSITGKGKHGEEKKKEMLVAGVTPILLFYTALFFCLYKSYLIDGGFAL